MQPKITYLNNQTVSEFDEQVTLTCEALGDPTPTISWSFENRVFTEGEQVLIYLFIFRKVGQCTYSNLHRIFSIQIQIDNLSLHH